MVSRREFLESVAKLGAAAAILPGCGPRIASTIDSGGITVNDIHSQLNATMVRDIARPETAEAVSGIPRRDRPAAHLSIDGGRHAMGGQQFASDRRIRHERSREEKPSSSCNGEIELEQEFSGRSCTDISSTQAGEDVMAFVQKQTGATRWHRLAHSRDRAWARAEVPPFSVRRAFSWSVRRCRHRCQPVQT